MTAESKYRDLMDKQLSNSVNMDKHLDKMHKLAHVDSSKFNSKKKEELKFERCILLEEIKRDLIPDKISMTFPAILTGSFALSLIYNSYDILKQYNTLNFPTIFTVTSSVIISAISLNFVRMELKRRKEQNVIDVLNMYTMCKKADMKCLDKMYNSEYQDIVNIMAALGSPEARKVRYKNYLENKIYSNVFNTLNEDESFKF